MTRRPGVLLFAVLLLAASVALTGLADAEETKADVRGVPKLEPSIEPKIDTLQEMFARLKSCWKPPALAPEEAGMQITVLFSLTRTGEIFGKPKITYESEYANDDERLRYRTAVAETLQRCTPDAIYRWTWKCRGGATVADQI